MIKVEIEATITSVMPYDDFTQIGVSSPINGRPLPGVLGLIQLPAAARNLKEGIKEGDTVHLTIVVGAVDV